MRCVAAFVYMYVGSVTACEEGSFTIDRRGMEGIDGTCFEDMFGYIFCSTDVFSYAKHES